MNWTDFMSWADAFGNDVDQPTQKQVDRLRRMLGDVDVAVPPMAQPEFINRYWSPYARTVDNAGNAVDRALPFPDGENWDSLWAFRALGELDRETIR